MVYSSSVRAASSSVAFLSEAETGPEAVNTGSMIRVVGTAVGFFAACAGASLGFRALWRSGLVQDLLARKSPAGVPAAPQAKTLGAVLQEFSQAWANRPERVMAIKNTRNLGIDFNAFGARVRSQDEELFLVSSSWSEFCKEFVGANPRLSATARFVREIRARVAKNSLVLVFPVDALNDRAAQEAVRGAISDLSVIPASHSFRVAALFSGEMEDALHQRKGLVEAVHFVDVFERSR